MDMGGGTTIYLHHVYLIILNISDEVGVGGGTGEEGAPVMRGGMGVGIQRGKCHEGRK